MRRARTVLLVWERGRGGGHLARLSVISWALQKLGYSVVYSVRDRRYAEFLSVNWGAEVHALPASLALPKRAAVACSHPALLLNLGFGVASELGRYVGRWRDFLRQINPSVVFCDHADGALIAAHSLGLPRAVVGNPFFHPPLETPMRHYGLDQIIGDTATVEAEPVVVDSVNSCLRKFGSRALGCLADLYTPAPRIVPSFSELDSYGVRSDLNYLGVLEVEAAGADPVWRFDGERVFCYFTRGQKPSDEFVAQLVGAGFSVLLACPGMRRVDRERLEASGVAVIDRLVNLQRVCAECRIIFSEGNHGATANILRYGRVPLLIPSQVEQLAMSVRLSAEKRGILPSPSPQSEVFLRMIDVLQTDRSYDHAARDFSSRYKLHDRAATERAIGDAAAQIVRSV